MKKWLRKLREIKDGWVNDAFPTNEILKLANQRAEICAGCSLNVNNMCSSNVKDYPADDFEYYEEKRTKDKLYPGCGCPLSKKTKSLNSLCPLNKW